MTLPLLRNIPDSLETARLLIRVPQAGDGPALNAAVCDSLDELRPWMPWAQQPPSLDESEEVARQARVQFLERSNIMLLLTLKGTDTIIGGSGLHRIDWDVPRFEIGYWRRTGYEGQGYVAEAVGGITAFAFDVLGAQRVEIRMDGRNLRSRAVAERAGYYLEGELRQDSRAVDGSLRSTLVFSLLPDEYRRRIADGREGG
ncbi:MAG: GNAT family N-acetyltransferase [Anaerolineae bacterium]|nr:GNAT family N-acetyltransferase [Anaerolineae bacterium]